MSRNGNPHSSARSLFPTFLSLALMAIGGLVLFSCLMDGFYLSIVMPFLLAGLCHYCLWGRSLSQDGAEAKDQTKRFLEMAEVIGQSDSVLVEQTAVTTAQNEIRSAALNVIQPRLGRQP